MTVTRTTEQVKPFVPARFLGNAHAQTLYANLARRVPTLAARRERVELEDGDFVDVDVVAAERGPSTRHGSLVPRDPCLAQGDREEHQPWVLVLHGLEGSSEAPYVRGLAHMLAAQGVESCLLNYRGCSGEPNRLPRSYHSGETGDVLRAYEHLARTRRGPCALVGFSIGANLTMKLLGELGEQAPPFVLSIAVSPPFELERCARHLDRPAGLPYREHLLSTLRAKALAKLDHFPRLASAKGVRAARTFQAFDEEYTAPVHGFKGAHDYWERSSGGRYLEGIERDLLIITSDDDPFFPKGYVPEIARKMDTVELVLAPGGGHVGFVSGSVLAPRYWAEELASSRLASALGAVQLSS
jgi:predicted alpha/beta-fold hydrolase